VEIEPLADDDLDEALAVINAAAKAYDGAIPPDCYDEPYMDRETLAGEFEEMRMAGAWLDDRLVGVVGIQDVADVSLVRHLYVHPDVQRRGIGSRLLAEALDGAGSATVLVGTWRDATWAVDFYRGHGFENLGTDRGLLDRYWAIPDRQAEASIVLRTELDGD